MNIPVFCLGWRFVGRRFVLYSLWGMVIYSVMLHAMTVRIEIADKMLGAVVAAALSGTGVAIVLRSYGSTGGAEILCVILRKLFSIPLGAGSMILNAGILAVAVLLFPLEAVLYTLVYVALSSRITDMVFHALTKRQAAIIISDRWGGDRPGTDERPSGRDHADRRLGRLSGDRPDHPVFRLRPQEHVVAQESRPRQGPERVRRHHDRRGRHRRRGRQSAPLVDEAYPDTFLRLALMPWQRQRLV